MFVEYRQLLSGEWLGPTDEERAALDAAAKYLQETDAFDLRVCGPLGMPRNGLERGLVNNYAIQTRKRLCEAMGVSYHGFHEALRRLNHEKPIK